MRNIIGWTSWYCPVKGCNVIIYNTDLRKKYKIGVHKRKHKKYELFPDEIILMKELVVEKDRECKCDCVGPFKIKKGTIFKQTDQAYNFYQFFDYFHGKDKKPHEFLVRFDSVEDIRKGDEWSV